MHGESAPLANDDFLDVLLGVFTDRAEPDLSTLNESELVS